MALLPRLRTRPRSIRRIAGIGGFLTLLLGFGAWHIWDGHKVKPTAVAATALPDTNATPGGDRASPYIRHVTKVAIQRKALQALRQNVSATAELPPATSAPDNAVALPSPVTPGPTMPQVIKVSDPSATPASPPPPPSVNTARYAAYRAALKQLGLGTAPAYVTHVYERPAPVIVKASDPASTASAGAPADPVSRASASTMAARAPEKVLIPADHGIYARTLTGVNSDQSGATVIVEAESGAIAGDRMSGRFSTEGDRLVVTLTDLSLRDGQDVPIDAVLVAPANMDEAVATGVDHHYATRFILPIAAAFVQGLGQALESANSVVQESALGGVTQINHLNLGQSIGVAAGTAGQTAGALIQSAAPHGPTVTLAADANVGVLFLKPVKVPAGES
jgi:intracellular multiplication protein IcmE